MEMNGNNVLSVVNSAVKNRMETSLKVLTSMAKRPEVDIEFQDLTYKVDDEKKVILNGISGGFFTGKLTAILGPSGAGKSSLMNILVGYSSIGVTGNVLVNGKPRDLQLFHKLSSYIMQEDLMQEGITVDEAMRVAAELKLGMELKSQDKLLVIEEILTTLGLDTCRGVRTENLSGGQKKRLVIALELVNNPPIIFLDEPTSGLDIVSMNQCISLLKYLAHCGRTIICTIHQPSATVLSMFDKIYILAEGKCVYQGDPQNMVAFMKNSGLDCPVTYNPADFFMESLQMNARIVDKLSNAIENGNICESSNEHRRKNISRQTDDGISGIMTNTDFASSFYTQFITILKRMMLQKARNKTSIKIQMLNHLSATILIGSIFYKVGDDGRANDANFKFCMSVMVFFAYTYVMTQVLIFPIEFKLLRREYFNRWYGLKAYYAALSICNIPTMAILGTIFVAVTYYTSGQLMEFDRFLLFNMVGISVAYCSEGFGLAIGSVFTIQNGSIVAPALATPLMVLSIYGMGFNRHVSTIMKFIMHLSYLRISIVAFIVTVYQNRQQLACLDSPYCHYSYPKILLRDLGMGESSYTYYVLGILFYALFFRGFAYLVLRYRLQVEFSNRFLNYMSRYVRYKY